VFLLFPQVWHRYRCTANVRHTHVWAVFGGSQAQHLLRRKLVSPQEPVLKAGMHESVLQPFRRMLACWRRAARAAAEAWLLRARRARSSLAAHHADPRHRGVSATSSASHRVPGRQGAEVDVGRRMATRLHLSYDQFRHVFKQRTGLPPYQ